MGDDIFTLRDGFVEQFAKVFKNEGWKAKFHENESYWSFLRSLPDFDVTTSFSGQDIQQLTRNPSVSIFAGLSK